VIFEEPQRSSSSPCKTESPALSSLTVESDVIFSAVILHSLYLLYCLSISFDDVTEKLTGHFIICTIFV